jgi:hypothetical protein
MDFRDGGHRNIRYATKIEDVLFTDESESNEAEANALIGA